MGGMIKCPTCGKLLHSLHRHDFQQCECGTYVDGGYDYMRVGGPNLDDIKSISHKHLAGNKGVILLDD